MAHVYTCIRLVMGAMRVQLNELHQIILEALLNAYDVLGVAPNASDEDIKRAYRKLAVELHPDRQTDAAAKAKAHTRMVDINKAFDRLKNKDELFRRGPIFPGYEDPNAPKPAPQPAPPNAGSGVGRAQQMASCPWCGRSVRLDSLYTMINHYTQEGGSTKCPGSGRDPVGYAASVRRRAGAPSPTGQAPAGAAPPPRPNPWSNTRDPGPNPNSHAPPPPQPGYRYYYTYQEGTSNKFWEVEVVGSTVYVRYGRIGTNGKTNSKTYPSGYRAQKAAKTMRRGKVRKGYTYSTPPVGSPRPSATASAPPPAGGARPSADRPSASVSGSPRKNTYKVYPWRGGRRVVRVGGKLYGTNQGGTLRSGGNTRFNANDRVRVTKDGERMKVGSTSDDHTQTWDPVDEVRQVVDELVLEMIVRIAEG